MNSPRYAPAGLLIEPGHAIRSRLQAGMSGSGTVRQDRSGEEQQLMGAPGCLFDMSVPWLCHRAALQASRQHPDGLGECICLYLEPVHALLHRDRVGRIACFRWCAHD